MSIIPSCIRYGHVRLVEKVKVNGNAEKEEDLSASNSRYDKSEQYFKRRVTNHGCTSRWQKVNRNK
jgi:hypothetical protein